jgi:hypothetical protein
MLGHGRSSERADWTTARVDGPALLGNRLCADTVPERIDMAGIAVTRRFQAFLAAAGLPRQRFHDLRQATLRG